MTQTTRQFRSGFTGLEILFPLFILFLIVTAFLKMFSPTVADDPQPKTTSAMARTADAVKESARAGTAVMRLAKEADPQEPAAEPVDVPTADSIVEPDDGLDLGDILEGILDGL